jgi:hypothetical protein
VKVKKMKILISGAGTAGLCVAYWLKRYGFTPTIIESAPMLRTGGYKIDIRGEALQVLHRAGIYDAVVAANTDMQGALLVDKNGKVIHEMRGDTFGHRLGNDQEIMRGTLNKILLDQIPEVEIIFGDAIQHVSQIADSIHVEFKKNSPRTFDLLIGADGLHSNVRRLVFGDEQQFSRLLGINLCVFSLPNYLNLDQFEKIMRPYIHLNQELGVRAAKLFRSQEKKNPLTWLMGKAMNFLPGRVIEFFIQRATKRINQAANSIALKDYSF